MLSLSNISNSDSYDVDFGKKKKKKKPLWIPVNVINKIIGTFTMYVDADMDLAFIECAGVQDTHWKSKQK